MSPISNIRRRQVLRFALGLPLLSSFKLAAGSDNQAVAFGTTAVFLDNEISLLNRWSQELGTLRSAIAIVRLTTCSLKADLMSPGCVASPTLRIFRQCA